MSRAIFNCLAGGTVTLDAADTGSNKVLIIPAADGTLLYDDGTGTQTFDNLVVSGNALLFSGQVTTTPSSGLDIANKAYVDNSIIADAYTAGTGLTLTGHEFKITDTAVTAGTYGTAARNMTLAVNARGQITSVFDQPIDIAATQVTSGILDAARLSGSYTGITTVGTLTGLTVSTAIAGSITGNAGSATNIAGGLSGSVPYQTAAGATSLLAKGTDGQVLSLVSGLPAWISVSGAGTVTSVDGSGGTTGLTLTGGPITSSGTLTLGGTLAVANGGTGATTLTGYVKGNGTSAMTASATIPTTDLSGTISNAQLANSAITINGTSTSLGGSISVGTVTSVTGTAPVVSSGGATPAISMAAATASVNGYLTSTDWSTFNNKGSGTVTSVAASVPSFLSVAGSPITSSGTLAITYSGTALPTANGGTGSTTATGSGSNVLATSPTITGLTFTSAATAAPAFSAYQSTAQSLSASVYTKLQFQTKEFDTNNNFDNTTNFRFTPTVAGYYQITAGFSIASSRTGMRMSIYKNGSAFKSIAINSDSTTTFIAGSALVYANGSTDYFEIYGVSDASQNTSNSATTTYFQAAMIRSA